MTAPQLTFDPLTPTMWLPGAGNASLLQSPARVLISADPDEISWHYAEFIADRLARANYTLIANAGNGIGIAAVRHGCGLIILDTEPLQRVGNTRHSQPVCNAAVWDPWFDESCCYHVHVPEYAEGADFYSCASALATHRVHVPAGLPNTFNPHKWTEKAFSLR